MTPEEKSEAVLDALADCDGRWEGGSHRWEPCIDGYEFCYYCDALRRTKEAIDGEDIA